MRINAPYLVYCFGNISSALQVELIDINAICSRVSRALDVPSAAVPKGGGDFSAQQSGSTGDEDCSLRHCDSWGDESMTPFGEDVTAAVTDV